ncbi:DUF58 domain-containing protein [Actinomyces sp. B33]|uniref:DUF58 domain-containing protein n=1 Tax=Actinomyces sp. B33 TaxID=2942131 RepID=UPI00233FE753|nr:DUF58 domain-containing protein [Actinomyces sp. B33]MDC4233625.1 DUF58 domain-containing protein [Actinomyces sp. B33]
MAPSRRRDASRQTGAPASFADAARLRVARIRDSAPLRPLRRAAALLTPSGRAALSLLVVASGLGGLAHWQEMRTVAVILAVVLASSLLWLVRRPAWDVRREILDKRISVGDRALVHVRIANPSSRRIPGARMKMDIGGRTVSLDVPPLHPGEDFEEGFSIPTRKRGVVVLGPILSAVGDPLGLLSSEKSWTGSLTIYVHPRTVRISRGLTGNLRDIEGRVTQTLSSSDVSFHALREYAPGDDRRSIHWRSTAHTGSLMVRQFEETRRATLLVVLSCAPSDYASDEDFETAVSSACSLALKGMSEDIGVRVLVGDDFLPVSSPRRLLDASCGVTLHDSPSCDSLARHGLAAHPSTSVVVMVTGQEAPHELLARTRTLMPPGIAAAAIRCGERDLSMRHVGGMPVFDLSAIGQLPRAMAVAAR